MQIAAFVAVLGASMPTAWGESIVERRDSVSEAKGARFTSLDRETSPTLQALIAEALAGNPELQALDGERRAARHRAASAGALDDPMLEAGVLNLPVDSLRFNREDMTMKMIGVSQRLPHPGKRALREQIAVKEAGTVELNYREAANRAVRDVKVAYFDLAYAARAAQLIDRNRTVLEQFLQLAESRYALGQATQADVLKAQTQLAKMIDEGHRVGRERSTAEAELTRAVGRPELVAGLAPVLPEGRGGAWIKRHWKVLRVTSVLNSKRCARPSNAPTSRSSSSARTISPISTSACSTDSGTARRMACAATTW